MLTNTKKIAEIDVKINHIMHELVELKKVMIPLKIKDKDKTNQAWADLMAATEDITKLWEGIQPWRKSGSREKRGGNAINPGQFCLCGCTP